MRVQRTARVYRGAPRKLIVDRDGLEPLGVFANAFGLLDGPGSAGVVFVGADLVQWNRFETLLQGGRIRLQAEIAVFRVDEHRIRDDRMNVAARLLPGFPLRRRHDFFQRPGR